MDDMEDEELLRFIEEFFSVGPALVLTPELEAMMEEILEMDTEDLLTDEVPLVLSPELDAIMAEILEMDDEYLLTDDEVFKFGKVSAPAPIVMSPVLVLTPLLDAVMEGMDEEALLTDDEFDESYYYEVY